MHPAPGIRVRAARGIEIRVDAPVATPSEQLEAWIHGPAVTAILYQRKRTPLHASAIGFDGGVVAILAPSGTGKSSLAAHLLGRGYHLVTDDVLAVTRDPALGAIGYPGPAWLRLPRETHERSVSGDLDVVRPDSDDRLLVAPRRPVPPGPRPIRALVLLRIGGERVSAAPLEGTRLLTGLRQLVHRPRLAHWLGTEAAVFDDLSLLTRRVPAWEISRPASGWTLPECGAMIQQLVPGG
jgi:hypothetical protein